VFTATQRRGLPVDLVGNAGRHLWAFDRLDAEREQQEILLNVATVVDLTHRFLPAMVARGSGAIVNVASTSAFQPTPYMAVYGASKAFVLSFSEALWAEYRSKGIRVLALCPGPTSTDFFTVVGTEDASFGAKETPEKVVQVALRALQPMRQPIRDLGPHELVAGANSVRLSPRGHWSSAWERADTRRPGHSGRRAKA
jgi:short-subunit dehydrogenase